MLGVGTAAQNFYAVMQQQPRAGVRALAGLAGLTEDEVRAALDELVTLKLLRGSRGHSGEFVTVPLVIALPELMRRQEKELAARQRAITESRAAAARLIAEQIAPAPAAQRVPGAPVTTEHLHGADAIQNRLDTLVAGAGTEVLSLIAGRKMGISGRTVRRIMADLMQRLNAESRFEAGMKAAKNGWL